MKRPCRYSESELRKVHVSILEGKGFRLRCDICGRKWALDIREDRRKMPARYWHCPNGCNTP